MSIKNINIGIAGLGTVGAGVAKILQNQADLISNRCGNEINITAVSARSKNKDRGFSMDGITWYKNPVDIANDENVDIVVELIGGDSGAAYDLAEATLKNGKNFVTANKALVARHGKYLAELAEQNNAYIAFEAAVAGGIPIIKALKEGLAGNNITKVSGILNGTCNYMLTAMRETGRDFEEILKEAQDLGYAEADPTFDVGGIDAAHKLAILTSIAFGVEPDFDSIYIEGITKVSLLDIRYAESLGYKVKLLGITTKGENGISQRVTPCLVSDKYPVAKVEGVNNAVYVEGDAVGKVVLEGPGAGQGPTASAVVGDIIDMASNRFSNAFGIPTGKFSKEVFTKIEDYEGSYYIRIDADDKPGVLASISDTLSESAISVNSIIQKSPEEGKNANIIVLTHKTSEKSIIKAVEKIEKIDSVIKQLNLIRVES